MWEHCNWRTLPSIDEALPDRDDHESSDLSIYRFAKLHCGIGVISRTVLCCSAGGFSIEHGKNSASFEELSRLWPGTHPIASSVSTAWRSWVQLTRVEPIVPSSLRCTSNEIWQYGASLERHRGLLFRFDEDFNVHLHTRRRWFSFRLDRRVVAMLFRLCHLACCHLDSGYLTRLRPDVNWLT
jgi:hypothetical protein